MRHRRSFVSIVLMVFLVLCVQSIAQTGKIAGRITDETSGEALTGANVVIVGTGMGTASDQNGQYYIINIPPGKYDIQFSMMGYNKVLAKDIRVSLNSTTTLDITLNQQVIEGEVVVVTADAMATKKDETSSIRKVSSDEIELLPVESLSGIINMQAGVVDGHFRGGRNTEVSYLIDGIQVDRSFNQTGQMVSLEKEVIEEVEVITGTFNAEYGKAMSGLVNAITKDGGNNFSGSVSSSFSNYLTSHSDIFIGLNKSGFLTRNLSQDYKAQLSGPIYKNKLFFIVNYRFQNNNGFLNGIRLFNPDDLSIYTSPDPNQWYTEQTGDGAYVSMDHDIYHNLFAKLTYKPLKSLKLQSSFTFNKNQTQGYSHAWKYNPDPLNKDYDTSFLGTLNINHMLSPSMFYELKLSYDNRVEKRYLYEDPLDSRYLHPFYRELGETYTAFYTGGTPGPTHPTDTFTDMNVKFDYYWQLNEEHGLKAGVLYTAHTIDRTRIDVRNIYSGLNIENQAEIDPITGQIYFPYYELEVVPITENTIDIYTVNPYEFAGYIQDKMEFNEMVINLGVRYDYFNSDFVYPSDRRNPSNQLNLPDSMMSTYIDAPAQVQLSPRLGLSYQLSDQAKLHFSYGHFFQMPPMSAMYRNNIFRVPPGDYETTMGNTQLKAQKTITYEIGFWQELMAGMGLDIALYYKDIYDLLSTKIISTYNEIEYGLYTNKDYGNARGFELKWNFDYQKFYANINYTLAYTKGNADNPEQTFNRAGDSQDPIKRFIPMSWDQRHTLNATVGYSTPDLGVTVSSYFNSGTPYTYSPLDYSYLADINLYANNAYRPQSYRVDLSAYINLLKFGKNKLRLILNIYNALDRLNARTVDGTTGQPYTEIVEETDILNHRSNFNDYMDRVHDPNDYRAPREVKLGLEYRF